MECDEECQDCQQHCEECTCDDCRMDRAAEFWNGMQEARE